jgi:hypothetical protein
MRQASTVPCPVSVNTVRVATTGWRAWGRIFIQAMLCREHSHMPHTGRCLVAQRAGALLHDGGRSMQLTPVLASRPAPGSAAMARDLQLTGEPLRMPEANGYPRGYSVRGAVLAPCRVSWRALAAASRVVLLYHTGGDAPALADHHAMLLCPCADISGALAVGHSPPGAARMRPPGPACVLKVGRELLAERGGILGVQVDLVVGAIEREPDGCSAGPPVRSSSRTTLTFWAISTFPPSIVPRTRLSFPTASPSRAATLSYCC